MTDREVLERFNNAWRALCKQYREYPRAVERFRRPPYQAARMIRNQGRQLEHKSVAQYIADKFGIDGEDDNRGQENT